MSAGASAERARRSRGRSVACLALLNRSAFGFAPRLLYLIYVCMQKRIHKYATCSTCRFAHIHLRVQAQELYTDACMYPPTPTHAHTLNNAAQHITSHHITSRRITSHLITQPNPTHVAYVCAGKVYINLVFRYILFTFRPHYLQLLIVNAPHLPDFQIRILPYSVASAALISVL